MISSFHARLCYCLLWLIPCVVYSPAIFHDYGMRDDYSLLREVREEPGKVLSTTASHGRPLYGMLLQNSFAHIHQVADLVYLRLASIILLILLGILLQRQLMQSGWNFAESTSAAFIFILLPASQVTVSWAVAWPWGICLLLTLAGYNRVEASQRTGGFKSYFSMLAGITAYCLATLIYQSHVLFAVVLIAAALISPRHPLPISQTLRWLTLHLITLGCALMLSYVFMKYLFAAGIFAPSARLQFETEPLSKLHWFFYHPLPNALALLPLRDNFNTGFLLFCLAAGLVFSLIIMGLIMETGKNRRYRWLLCCGLLPWVAHSISLIAAERITGYRTTFALSGLVLVLTITALQKVFVAPWRHGIYGLLGLTACWLAAQQSYRLIAVPQGREWHLVKEAVNTMKPGVSLNIYLIEPKIDDRSTQRIYRDEFGSLSSNSSWVPDEMFKAALRERFPHGIPENLSYQFSHGSELPDDMKHYDRIIDMRSLAQWRQ